MVARTDTPTVKIPFITVIFHFFGVVLNNKRNIYACLLYTSHTLVTRG